ncbi:MAG: hypothetical protein DI635_00645 [Pseudoxanthomonas suwonensis]|nr:MAG: hypothetical protein DI635_00645 [Pseudoxanthomonas suwonensis]
MPSISNAPSISNVIPFRPFASMLHQHARHPAPPARSACIQQVKDELQAGGNGMRCVWQLQRSRLEGVAAGPCGGAA